MNILYTATLTLWGAVQTSLVYGWIWMFMLAWLILMAPDVEIGERYVLTLERRAVNIGRRGWGCFQEGRTFIQAVPLRVLWRHEGGNSGLTLGGKKPVEVGRLQEIPRSSQASNGSRHWLQQCSVQISINLASTLRRLISVDTAFQNLATKNKNPRPRTRIAPLLLSNPTVANLI